MKLFNHKSHKRLAMRHKRYLELSNAECKPWMKLVDFLEQYELHKENPKNRTTILGWVGLAFIFLTIIGISAVVMSLVYSDEDLAPVLLLLTTVAAIVGIVMFTSGLSSEAFASISRRAKSVVYALVTFVQVVAVIVELIMAIGLGVLPDYVKEDEWRDLSITLTAMIIALAVLVITLGSGPIDIGVLKMRSGVQNREVSIIIEGLALIVPMIVAIVTVGLKSEGIALALSFLLALVAYVRYRHSRLDASFNSAIESFDAVRGAAAECVEQFIEVGRLESTDAKLYEKYRQLQKKLNSSFSLDRRTFKGFGLNALCIVSEMRRTGDTDCRKYLKGRRRIELGQRVVSMSDLEFAVASAQVFDALIRTLNHSFAPQGRDSSENSNLRSCLAFHSIMDPESNETSYLLTSIDGR